MKIVSRANELIHEHLRNRVLLKSVILLVGGTAIAQIISIASSPIISRLFSPEDFGVLTVYSSILSIISAFATMRFDLAIPIADDDRSAFHLVILSLLSVTVVSLVVLILSVVAADPIILILKAEPLKPLLWMLSIGTLGIGTYSTMLHWAIRKKEYRDITRTKINQGIAKAFIQILSGFLMAGSFGLILGQMLGQAFGIRSLSKSLMTRDTPKEITLKTIKSVAVRYKKFPLVSSWSALLNMAGLQIPVLLLSSLYGTGVTGSFGFAQRIVSLPLALVGTAISQVFFSEGAVLSRDNPKRLLELTRSTAKKLLLVAFVLPAILIPFGPFLFEFVFGEVWREAGVYSRVLSIMLMVRIIVNPISQALSIIERQGTQFFLDLLRVLTVLAAFNISKLLNFAPLSAVAAYTVSMILIYAITYSVIIKLLKQRVRDFDTKYPVK